MEKLATATDPMAALPPDARAQRRVEDRRVGAARSRRGALEPVPRRRRSRPRALRAAAGPAVPPSRPNTSRARLRSASAPKRSRESTDWIATADALKALQAEWKTVGPAPRREEQAVWERFRAACNAFFTRRQDDLKRRKDDWTVNLEKKEALIVRAEALVESTDPDRAFVELKGLQAEWKAIGPVRSRSPNRSGSASARRPTRSSIAIAIAMRRRLPSACRTARRSARRSKRSPHAAARWPRRRACSRKCGACARAGSRPVPSRAIRRRALSDRFDHALGAIVPASPETFKHTELDVDGNRRQLELFCERVEKLGSREPVGAGAASPVATLASQLREALAANTIGGRVDEEGRWKNSEYEVRARRMRGARWDSCPRPPRRR